MAATSVHSLGVARHVRAVALRVWKMVRVNWYLGFTAFGGPPVHFRIFREKFVNKRSWIDEQIFQELFGVSQALSGPASTKMLYSINLIHGGSLAALLSFLLWSLPGALGMYALSIGVSNINDTLPGPVYALLSGLNAATVGVIALAAVELSEKSITDRLTRIIVFGSGAAGLLYNALWYFPVLIVVSGISTLVFDFRWLHKPVAKIARSILRLRSLWKPSRPAPRETPRSAEDAAPTATAATTTGAEQVEEIELEEHQSRFQPQSELPVSKQEAEARRDSPGPSAAEIEPRIIPRGVQLDFSWKKGTAILACYLLSFIVIMILRSVLPPPVPLLYQLFSNMYLAGTIIFGGGPVVIPLLREYVVAEGWVSPRDFLIGLALIQAWPGPNFNFAVFLGSLTAINNGYSSAAGAVIAWVGIFAPGMIMMHATMGIWSVARNRRWVKSLLRGVNAGAVGLIYTAVYRIWQVGYIDQGFQAGRSLGDDPWWVVVVATSYVGGRYFAVPAPVAILLGAVMGLVRYGVVN